MSYHRRCYFVNHSLALQCTAVQERWYEEINNVWPTIRKDAPNLSRHVPFKVRVDLTEVGGDGLCDLNHLQDARKLSCCS